MEIVKKDAVSLNGKAEEIEAVVINTGADRTMIDEEVLLKLTKSWIEM